jgi:iron(II)-dependent oxidoreductase
MDPKYPEWPKPTSGLTPEQTIANLAAARVQLDAFVACLPEDGWLGPQAEHLNPPLWEYGHVVWFQERWCLRWRPDQGLRESRIYGGDNLFDSSTVPHETRWSLPLPPPDAAREYGETVLAEVERRLLEDRSNALAYFGELALNHEQMHIEAWWMAWQNLGYRPPQPLGVREDLPMAPVQLVFAAGKVRLGSRPDAGFVFDNEKWQHEAMTPAFEIDATPVSEGAYTEFLDGDGYRRPELWSESGRQWLAQSQVQHPIYWRLGVGGWEVRRFDQWQPMAPARPLLHINRYEAEAYATFRGRRLPTAAEWCRATDDPGFRTGLGWEWMNGSFAPYPGFSPDPYATYSEPWFYTHAELRGGSPVSAPALTRPAYRNFYLPHRRDPFATCRTARDI